MKRENVSAELNGQADRVYRKLNKSGKEQPWGLAGGDTSCARCGKYRELSGYGWEGRLEGKPLCEECMNVLVAAENKAASG